jgi:hypothetical protein
MGHPADLYAAELPRVWHQGKERRRDTDEELVALLVLLIGSLIEEISGETQIPCGNDKQE